MTKDKVELIKDRYDLAYSNQKNKLAIFNAIDDVLNQKTKDFTHVSKLGSPYAWAAVEMVTPRVVAKNPTITYEPAEESDQDKAQSATDLFKYFQQKSSLFNVLTAWVKVANSYGSSVVKLTWKTEKRIVTQFVYQKDIVDPFTGATQTYSNPDGTPLINDNGEYETEEVEVTTYDDPYPELVNNNYLFFSPGSTDPKDANWIIHKYWKTIDELKAEQKQTGIYKNLNKLDPITSKDENTEDQSRHQSTGQNKELSDDTVDLIEILEMWDKNTGFQTMLANKSDVILDRKFPYWHGQLPFIKLVDSIVPFEWYGKGEVEPILKDIYAIDVLENSRLDELTSGQKKWKIRNGANIDENELYEPDLPLHVDDMNNDAQLVTLPQVTGSNSQEIELRQASIQNTLGTADYTSAADSTVDRTATGSNIKAEQMNSRFNHKTQIFEMALKELGQQVLALYQQFLTSERSLRILGDNGVEWKKLTPQDIAGEFDCVVEAGSSQPIDKESDKQNSLVALQTFAESPFVKQEELIKQSLEKFFPKQFQNILQDPDQVKEQQLNELFQMPQVQELIKQQAQELAKGFLNTQIQ